MTPTTRWSWWWPVVRHPAATDAFEERFGCRLQTLYSLTEAPLAIMSPAGQACVDGAVGLPMVTPAGVDNAVRIVDEHLEEVSPGSPGEIVIRNPALMKTYLKDPAATDQALVNGWLRTGDRGVAGRQWLDPFPWAGQGCHPQKRGKYQRRKWNR